MSTSMEHRWGQRVPADLPVMIICEGRQFGMGRVSNVSLSGALLSTALKMPVHASISISPIGEDTLHDDLFACVVRTLPDGFAVEWRDMASASVVSLLERICPDALKYVQQDPYAA